MLDSVAEDPAFIKRSITGDQACVYEYDAQVVQQSSEWRPKNELKPKESNSMKLFMENCIKPCLVLTQKEYILTGTRYMF